MLEQICTRISLSCSTNRTISLLYCPLSTQSPLHFAVFLTQRYLYLLQRKSKYLTMFPASDLKKTFFINVLLFSKIMHPIFAEMLNHNNHNHNNSHPTLLPLPISTLFLHSYRNVFSFFQDGGICKFLTPSLDQNVP